MSLSRDSGYDGENSEGIHDIIPDAQTDDSVFYSDTGLQTSPLIMYQKMIK